MKRRILGTPSRISTFAHFLRTKKRKRHGASYETPEYHREESRQPASQAGGGAS